MEITAITPQKKNTGKFNIFIDGVYVFALLPQDIAYFKLKEGVVVAEETVEFIRKNLIYIKAQDAALHFIGYKMRTEKEICQKLLEKEFEEKTVEEVLEFLKKYGYCDDRQYAEKYIKERLRLSPRSAFVLKMELLQKGVEEKVAEEAVNAAAPVEEEDALRWLRKKTKGDWPPQEKKKKQLYGFLLRKGYSYDVVNDAFSHMDEEARG